jgi:hypothetical protein
VSDPPEPSPPEPDPAGLAALSDEELIARAGQGDRRDPYAMELQRRANVGQAELTAAIREFKAAADRSSRWVLVLTIVLVVLTVLITVLTLILVIDPPAEPDL